MSSRDTKIKRRLLESGLGMLAKEYEKNPSYGHTCMHDNIVPSALRAAGTKTQYIGKFPYLLANVLPLTYVQDKEYGESYHKKQQANENW